MPSVVGVLVSEVPARTKPQSAPPAQETVIEPKPRPSPLPTRASVPPVRKTPPSERSETAQPPEPERPPTVSSVEVAQPAPANAPAQEAHSPPPVVPPRSDASHLDNPAPVYPPESRRRREQGRVLFEVYVLIDGSVGDLRLQQSSGFPRLDAAALSAVKRWRYVPARRAGEAIPYWYSQPVDFVLNP
jgi:periplasmic protein TonB